MIDARLAGDVLVRSAGIYAAPRAIKVNQPMTLAALKSYLDSLGYVESSKEADSNRGRYQIKGNSIELFTSSAAMVNNRRQFPNLLIAFGASGKSITKITDLETKRNVDLAQLEPEMLTAISGDKGRKQKLITFKDLPKELVNAVLAIEDRQFFEHSGINFRGIARALWRDASEGQLQEGGSSITQQLVKNFFLTPERTFRRKIEEMMIAFTLETKLEKEEIFQLYANEIFMGQTGAYSVNGFGEAAAVYFNKDVVNLTLPESAFLAGIIRGPSLYSPYRDAERAKARRNQVLDSMIDAGFITRESAEQAKATDLKIQPRRSALNSDAPYFVDYLQQYLSDEKTASDLARQSYRVYTTIDMELQRAADKAVNETLAKLDQIFAKRKKDPIATGTLQAALVAINADTGEIVAMVGGRDYSQSQLNRAVDANRQPGSVFKPIVYATALNSAFDETAEEKITAATTFLDAPETFLYGGSKTYSPENFGKTYSNREVTMREALVHSLNVVTVRVAEKAGYNRVARMAEKLGLPRPQGLPSTALGAAEATPLQIASAYTAFANNGRRVEATPIKRVTNSDGVGIIEPKPQTNDALRPEVSWILTNIMQDVINRGTASRARAMGFTATAAGKTGTSRDGWFAGFTPNLVCAVWVGFDDNRELGLEGSKSALPIWTAFMKEALAKRPDLAGNNFPKPEGVIEVEIDPTTGKLWTDSCPEKRADYFIEGTQPEQECDVHAGDFIPLPDFEWPETSGIRERAKEIVRDAERAVDDLGRKMRREIKKALEIP
jgi:penicillin-binding protein 1B